MKKTFSSKKSAFSLIELSIVLIIIGLLIAGITGGASLIKSSELRSIMGEARGYAVAVNSFFTQYDRYPGDTDINVGTSSTCNGDRDNTIEYLITSPANCSEGIDAWNDLKDIGAIDLALTLTTTQTAASTVPVLVPVTNIPGSKIKGAGWAFDYLTIDSSLHNVVVLTGTTLAKTKLIDDSTLANRGASGIVSPGDALSIDSKIDDGKADSGNVKGWDKSTAGAAGGCRASTSSLYYVADGSKKNCILSFRVDVSS
ncbi:MAG: prepilin-type N-terminal cleavage/methylation domain-containing protein [Proteobacteria bacterium]|nr:prepilin-type N-terminal cleavage/methylation domain-containing protein [Pseudomonadota bacterium]NCA28218.1 prepilin-type N-terminal cleavage/methylation domain-containing protein [Pseudomonadota bacterium]